MNDAKTAVLHVGNDPAEARLIAEVLAGSVDGGFHVTSVTRLSDALERLRTNEIAVVLLDLVLADCAGIEVFDRVFRAAPKALTLVLAAADDEETARLAVRRGAQDYFVKGHVDAHWLPRALRYAIERKAARDALLTSEARFRAMSNASPLGIFVSDGAGNCVYTNSAYQKISGLSLAQTLGTNWSLAIHPDDRQRVLAGWREAVASCEPFQSEFRFLRNDGSIVWTRINSAAMGDGLEPMARVKTVEDITERKAAEFVLRAAEEALFEEKERAQVTLNSIGDAVLTTDLQGKVRYLNAVAEAMTGWSSADALGRPLAEVFAIIAGTTREIAANPAQRAIAENRTVGLSSDCVLIRRDGMELAIEDSAAPIHNRDGQVTGAVLVFHDVSKSRAMALKMSHLAQHDFLTDLPNRALLTERLSQAIGRAQRHGKQVALLFLDMDYFKHINDSLGHAIGDQLLQAVAARLVECVRGTDTVCRQGGDEFVILLAEIDRPQDAAHVAEKLLAALSLPHSIDGHELHVTLSIGISIYPDDGIREDTVMQNADTAMYHAKTSGRNNYQFFTPDMNARAVQRLFVESSLRRALKQDEFILNYQPQIDLGSGVMTGSEALIRWMDPNLGLVVPDQFVQVAEECGLIVPIGQWVLREACRQVQAWLSSGLRAVRVAVNISAVQFRHKGFLESVASILTETGLAPRYLELELTESVLMHDAEASILVLEALKALGVQIAIDDFGTGYSSLAYLQRFPIDTLKIDRSFVRDIATSADGATIVSAVIGMGRNLKQRVIAEGVETPEQLAFLRTQHCAEGQGFLFDRPLSPEDFAALLSSGNAEVPSRRMA
jgi:diguanylate cyclase (GGDEF)-like protein/PAS domain S-box-containing protein